MCEDLDKDEIEETRIITLALAIEKLNGLLAIAAREQNKEITPKDIVPIEKMTLKRPANEWNTYIINPFSFFQKT